MEHPLNNLEVLEEITVTLLAVDHPNHMALLPAATMEVHLKTTVPHQLVNHLNLTEHLQAAVHRKAMEHLKLLLLQAMELHLLEVEDHRNPMALLNPHRKTMALLLPAHLRVMELLLRLPATTELPQEASLMPAMEDTATRTNRHFVHIYRLINLLRQIVQY